MPLNYGLMANVPSVASRYMEGQQAAQQEADRNMLRQMQMEDRALQMQQRQQQMQQSAQFDQLAELIRQHGMDPDDPKVLGEFMGAALKARQPQVAQMVGQMAERAAARRAAREESASIANILAPRAAAAPAQNALAAPEAPGMPATPPVAPPVAPAAPVNALADIERQRDALEALGTPRALAEAKRLDRQIERLQPKQFAPSPDMQGYELAKKEGFKGSFFDYKRQLAEAGRAPAQPAAPQAPVAVVDPATGKTVYVSREEALTGRMTPAAAIEGLTPKERQAREAKYPQATAAVKTFESTTDTLIKDLQKLATHPGLSSITGIAAGRLPGVTSAGREAEALYNKIVARGGFQELQNMRNASPTGGALGNISNQEGAQLRQAFAAIDRTQDAASVRKAIADAVEQLQGSKSRVREAYDMTYEYKQPSGAAPALAPAATKSGATVSNW